MTTYRRMKKLLKNKYSHCIGRSWSKYNIALRVILSESVCTCVCSLVWGKKTASLRCCFLRVVTSISDTGFLSGLEITKCAKMPIQTLEICHLLNILVLLIATRTLHPTICPSSAILYVDAWDWIQVLMDARQAFLLTELPP